MLTSGDIYLFHEGNYFKAYQEFGSHYTESDGAEGVRFTVWAPHAVKVGVAGDFNNWQGSCNPMDKISGSGIWSAFIPGLKPGELYKYEIHTGQGEVFFKADPFAVFSETRPQTASIVYSLSGYPWRDDYWRQNYQLSYRRPVNIYEVHLGSWKRKEHDNFYSYREILPELVDYVREMGFTHIELLPLMEHPLDGSWGYQVTGFYAVTSRYGTPHDFCYFVDYCHQKGIGVILDWVPAHFCRDSHGLSNFDGTPLYEARENVEWGTLQFDYSRPEVRSFLISNAIFWFDLYHVDGLRIDAVASMLYPNYREGRQWKKNKGDSRENPEAVAFMKRLNEAVYENFPNALMIAEESTTWPLVTRPTYYGGLGFNYKWNMGWMNDLLRYMRLEYDGRSKQHNLLTFSMLYAFSENFILPLSHDEVVHGKKSLIEKMPGDYWQKFANLRLLLGYMMAHPGKKLLFMGGEFAQFIEWCYFKQLDWMLLGFEMHRNFQRYVKELNHFYLREKSLWELDHESSGFYWIDPDNSEQCIALFVRSAEDTGDFLIVACNFTPAFYETYRLGVPKPGIYQEVFNSDLGIYGGSDQRNQNALQSENKAWHNQPHSIQLKLPPLAVVFLRLTNLTSAPGEQV
ncbi:MAG: 1,4-alpha-glucan branching protein GlgB [Bacillota bacterium]